MKIGTHSGSIKQQEVIPYSVNFLAHLYLSGENPKLQVGNFIADFVKGRSALQHFEYAIVKGIELHRAIDLFTDSHSIVSQSKNRLRPKYRHYSGVIVDVYYDHFLAREWFHYHHEPLIDFSQRMYAVLQQHHHILPDAVKHMLRYMVRQNWLLNYSTLEGINMALTGMSRRTPYESKMDEAVLDLKKDYEEFKSEFTGFCPDLVRHAESLR
jgi:acyl carrier protein phosphodiesterase